MVRSPPKKTKKNNVGPRYTPDSVDDLSDENNAIMTPVIRTSNATTMQSAIPLNQRVNFAGEVRTWEIDLCFAEISHTALKIHSCMFTVRKN